MLDFIRGGMSAQASLTSCFGLHFSDVLSLFVQFSVVTQLLDGFIFTRDQSLVWILFIPTIQLNYSGPEMLIHSPSDAGSRRPLDAR